MFFYIVAFFIFLIDQFLKQLVHGSMYLGQSIPLVDNILRLTYVRNTGAAFSLFLGFSPYLIAVGVLAALAIIFFHFEVPSKSYYLQDALAMILGGSLGNLVDRIFRGYVIDYVDFGFWPVFNFADVMINVGVLLIIFRLMKKTRDNASTPF